MDGKAMARKLREKTASWQLRPANPFAKGPLLPPTGPPSQRTGSVDFAVVAELVDAQR